MGLVAPNKKWLLFPDEAANLLTETYRGYCNTIVFCFVFA